MSGIDVGKRAAHRIVLRQEGGGEAQSSLAVGAGILIHARDQFGQRAGDGGEGFEAGLKRCHQQGCGYALSRYVGHGHKEPGFAGRGGGAGEDVVVVSGDGIRRTGGKGNRQPGHLGRSCRQQPALDIARDFQIALHDHPVRDLEHQQDEQHDPAVEMKVKLNHFDRSRFSSNG